MERQRQDVLTEAGSLIFFFFFFFFPHCLVLFAASTAIWTSSFSLAFLDGLPALQKGRW